MEGLSELQQKIEFVKGRTSKEEKVLNYIKQEYADKLDLDKFVFDIISLHEEFLDKMEEENVFAYSNDDEHEYIAEKTHYSTEMIELVLWFDECYQMKMNCVTYVANCKKCDSDKLYFREEEGEIFSIYIECESCGEKYSLDDLISLF